MGADGSRVPRIVWAWFRGDRQGGPQEEERPAETAARWGRAPGAPGAARVSEDGADRVGVEGKSEDPRLGAASGTARRVNLAGALEQLPPEPSARP